MEGEEYIPEHGGEVDEKRRSWGEKRREINGYWCFLHMGKMKNKGALSLLKLEILDFLLGCFTNCFIDG